MLPSGKLFSSTLHTIILGLRDKRPDFLIKFLLYFFFNSSGFFPIIISFKHSSKKLNSPFSNFFLLPFSTIPHYINQAKLFVNEICNNFKYVYFVNTDNLVERTKVKKYNNKNFLNLPKKVKFFNKD